MQMRSSSRLHCRGASVYVLARKRHPHRLGSLQSAKTVWYWAKFWKDCTVIHPFRAVASIQPLARTTQLKPQLWVEVSLRAFIELPITIFKAIILIALSLAIIAEW